MATPWNFGAYTLTAAVVLCAFGAASQPLMAGRIEWVPVSATGPHTINGNTITLNHTNGMEVTLELRISNWDPEQDNNPRLSALQAAVDSTGYQNGSGYLLSPANAFIAVNRCSVGQVFPPTGAPCQSGANCPAGELCLPDPRYVFHGFQPLPVLSTSDPNYYFGGVEQTGQGKPDDGLTYYAGTLVLTVPPGARGTYTIGFVNDINFTFLNDQQGLLIDIAQLVPAKIRTVCISSSACNVGPCTAGTCVSNSCVFAPRAAGFSCADPSFCNGAETCDGSGVCLPGDAPCDALPNASCDETNGCVAPGNFNGDNLINLDDWFDFASCVTGPTVASSSPCMPARMDNDSDVDLKDVYHFVNVFTGD